MATVSAPTLRDEGDTCLVESVVRVGDISRTLWYRLPSAYAPDMSLVGDALLAATLTVAMAAGEDLDIDAPVSPLLLRRSDTIQGIFSTWYPTKMRRIKVTAPAREAAPDPKVSGAVSCFTGGADSFYSFIKNREQITSLLFVHGFDIPLADEAFRRETSERLNAVSAEAKIPLIEVATNIRQFMDGPLDWGKMSHGAALASVGQMLSSHHRTMFLPSSHSYASMPPRGSHAALDYLWSSENLEVIHDGAEASRIDKVRTLAHDPAAQHHLRVCWKKTGDYNCGRCEKCLRTMTTLHLLGVLDKFEVFATPFSVERLSELVILGPVSESYQASNLRLAESVDPESDVAQALRQILLTFRDSQSEEARAKSSTSAATFPQVRAQVQRMAVTIDKQGRRIEALERAVPLRVWRSISRMLKPRRRNK